MRRRLRRPILLVVLLVCASCASAPPSLSQAGVAAFHATRIVQELDLMRDAAIGANSLTPPLLSADTTRKVVTWHRATLRTIQAVPNGWLLTLSAGLDQLVLSVPAEERRILTPYVIAIKFVLDTMRLL